MLVPWDYDRWTNEQGDNTALHVGSELKQVYREILFHYSPITCRVWQQLSGTRRAKKMWETQRIQILPVRVSNQVNIYRRGAYVQNYFPHYLWSYAKNGDVFKLRILWCWSILTIRTRMNVCTPTQIWCRLFNDTTNPMWTHVIYNLIWNNGTFLICININLFIINMGVKPGLWHWGRNIDWGCLRTGCWRKYLDLREMKWQEVGKNCIMRSFITCTLLQV
jgi:hypothetical protein